MKTPEQIRDWLEKQEWYLQFKMNAYGCCGVRSSKRVLNGECSRGTILLSFDWRRTEEGFDFWSMIDKEFQEWYNKED